MDGATGQNSTAKKLKRRWDDLSLTVRFALIGGLLMVTCAIIIGRYVTSRIEQNAIDNSAAATALYIDSLIAPLVRDVKNAETLSVGPILAIEQLLEQDMGREFLSAKVWARDGTLIYATDRELIGQSFPPSDELTRAFGGQVVAERGTLGDEEDAIERRSGAPLLEIYSPIRQALTGDVIAVAEFYEIVEKLDSTLRKTLLETWFLIGLLTLLIASALTGIVRAGSRIIETQRQEIQNQLLAESRTSTQNRILRERVERASANNVELNEQYLRRISADLHDGPAQLLGLAALKIDRLRKQTRGRNREDVETIGSALKDAMREIRQISRGLRLPEIEGLSVSRIINRACAAHSERTQTGVDIHIDEVDIPAGNPLKITIYRFMQEALSNAYQHGGGKDQVVRCSFEKGTGRLVLSVSDGGQGMEKDQQQQARDLHGNQGYMRGLGLIGLQERIESIGGSLEVESISGVGTTLTMQVTIEERS